MDEDISTRSAFFRAAMDTEPLPYLKAAYGC
jgi:hypothetical protein